jgi:transposase
MSDGLTAETAIETETTDAARQEGDGDRAAARQEGDGDRAAARRDWRIPDEMWERLAPLIPQPPPKPHPLGCHRPRVPDRRAMDAIFFVLRTGCQWNALSATGLCSSSVAHARFQGWAEAGVFEALWAQGLAEYDALVGIDWAWLSMDGAITKAPGLPRGEEQRQAGKRGRRSRRSAPARSTGARGAPSAAC